MKIFVLRILTLGWILLIWFLTTTPDFHPSSDTLLSLILSNGGHFVFFGILAVLLRLSLSFQPYTTFYALFSTSLYGILIELVQRTIPGRSFSLFDWSLDILGALAFLYIVRKYKS